MAGELNVEAMLRRLTAKQFRAWEIYSELEPFGELRADYRAASIVQMIYNVNRGEKQKALPLQEFLLKFEAESKKKQSWQEQLAIMKLLAAAHATDAPMPQVTVETYPSLDVVGTLGGKVTTEERKAVI